MDSSQDQEFFCQLKSCSFSSSSKREFNAHKLAHEGINAKRWLPYTCNQCPARFYSSEDQARHTELQGTKKFLCPSCPESFYFQQGLDMHFEQAHAGEPAGYKAAFQCPHCDSVCKTSLGLEMHLRWRFMGACLAKIPASTLEQGVEHGMDYQVAPAAPAAPAAPGAPGTPMAGEVPMAASAPAAQVMIPCQPVHMAVQPIAQALDGSSTPVYAPVPTLASSRIVSSASTSLAPTPRDATPVQPGLAAGAAKPSLCQLAAAVAANYHEMLSPTNSNDMAMGNYTPEDGRQKFSGTPNHMALAYSPGTLAFRNGVVTPLSITSPTTTPLSAAGPGLPGDASSNASFGSPRPEELSPSSRLSSRNESTGGSAPQRRANCPECMEQFSSRELLTYHLRTAHFVPLATERKFECKTCFKVCTTQSGLDYHNRTHLKSIEERRAYKCQECSQVFTVRSTLYRHQRTQHAATLDERKPYKCVYCGKAFASRYNLNRHADTRHPGLSRETLK